MRCYSIFFPLVVVFLTGALSQTTEETAPSTVIPPSDDETAELKETEKIEPANETEAKKTHIHPPEAEPEAQTQTDDELVDEPVIPENDSNSSEEESTSQGKQRLWGSAGSASAHANAAVNSGNSVTSDINDSSSSSSSSASQQQKQQHAEQQQPVHHQQAQQQQHANGEENATRGGSAHIPFISTKPHMHHHAPPDGFSISARVYLDPQDRHAHFDDSSPKPVTLPFWDCGATGATTSALPLKEAYFRQVLAAATTSWSSSDGRHPVLAVALSPLVIELNSGEIKRFEAGEVVLLEDVLLTGHRMRSVGGGDLKVLFLTLPQDHYHPGKENVSINVGAKSKDPCPNNSGSPMQDEKQAAGVPPRSSLKNTLRRGNWNARRLRLAFLAAFGMSVSTVVADFLGKTAPLWLAVGVGGTCFVGGGTFALTVAGDKLWTTVELWRERRKLGISGRSRRKSDEDSGPPQSGVVTMQQQQKQP